MYTRMGKLTYNFFCLFAFKQQTKINMQSTQKDYTHVWDLFLIPEKYRNDGERFVKEKKYVCVCNAYAWE